jgi:lipoprotein-anchoring transpeptidase ErfK/SrfK
MGLRRVGVLAGVTTVALLGASCAATITPRPKAAPVHHHHLQLHPHRTVQAVVAPPLDVGLVPKTTEVAATNGDIPGYPAPGQPSNMTVPGSWYGYPSMLPVIATQPGWLEVRLAQRPNGSTTWVAASTVTLSTTPYAIVIDLSTEHLSVYDNGTLVDDFPAGVGTPDDPTPTGSYFMAMKVPPPSPAYGAFVLATSDHSDSITDWENSGDAIIGIHGPITSYDDSLIGTTGAAISHGCVRLHDADLAQLTGIPAGTPINVIN